ncbi:hypothetical protein [Myxococcus landrumensis]|uniref:Lipoprotein n=1 Tax=Myxococcus landrumensis TaxID=2813577 RepID=A0ABX7N516_9BACT|nr:hypothetical protein [Myxococcus landrumus]QSQ13815.1 hypothetical protein JY572_36735 [Myxococcus landrumus]
MVRSLGSTLRRLRDTAVRFTQNTVGVAKTAYVVLRPDRAGSERAQRGAESLIAACRAFQARHGRFPEVLTELVPDFLPKLPRAKYDGPEFGFTYDSSHGRHVLGWTELIPFGRPFYVLEEDRWGYLD